jgi:FG-GAP-like repeat
MPSRLRVFPSVCLFAVLVSMQLLAQSNSASFARHRTRSLKSTNGLQTPALTFAGVTAYGSDGNGANAVAVADVNGDGQADMVVTNWCSDGNCTSGSVVVLTQSDGVFTPTQYLSGGLFADSLVVADVNGDGKLDLIVANCGSPSQTNCVSTSNSGNVAVLLGNGDGTFQAAVTHTLGASGASAVAVADVNGDGKPDLIVATGSNTEGLVGVLLGNGNGTFQPEVTYGSGGLSPLALAVGNLGNGHLDVVVANECADDTCTSSNVGVLVGKGDGTFPTTVPYGSGGLYSDGVAIADVNRDGKPDVVVANSSTSTTVDNGNVAVLLGNGDGTLHTAVSYGSGAFGAASVAVGDVNGDGILDLVVANCSSSASSCVPAGGNVGVLLGNGNGTFQTAHTYSAAGNAPFAVTLGDVNGDGRPDIVAGSCAGAACGAASGTVGVLINTTTPWLVYASLARQVDYFGLGTSDFTTFRPSTGTFFSEDGSGHTLIQPFGENGDIPVIGDYDGDGKTDVAVFRPSKGTWYIIPSFTRKPYGVQFGTQGDVPVPGDYDGDGRTDIAVWRPSKGAWYIIPSSSGKAYGVQFGTQGDVPVPGDYDGDGKTDIAVWRPSNQIWYILLSSTGKVVTYKWGLPTDKPVPADYDGDGKTDIAMWRPAAKAMWFIVPSSTKVAYSVQFGTTGDVPVPRDYDGDLKADVAVWRPSDQFWYVLQSSNGKVTTTHFGLSTDIPLNKPVGQ